jgi:hypothetical protein
MEGINGTFRACRVVCFISFPYQLKLPRLTQRDHVIFVPKYTYMYLVYLSDIVNVVQ